MTKRLVSSRPLLRRLLRKMKFDSAHGGLTLKEDFPQLHLRSGHRLLVNDAVRDIHDVENIELPAFIDFFDTNASSQLNVLTPLFHIPGFDTSCVHLDAMHVLDLGVSQYVAGAVMHSLCERNFARSTKAAGPKALPQGAQACKS
eukprot:6790741-Pyramimonas_sp.AAC.1